MSRRMWFLAAVAWVGVVIAGSTLTWLAIDRAGRQVTGAPASASTRPTVVGTADSTPMPSATPKQPAAPGSPTTTTAGPTRSSSPATVQSQTRTWSGAAGTVTVSCTGRTGRLLGSSPADGWHLEVGESDDEIEVTFERDELEVKVKAACVDGAPRFEAEPGSDERRNG